MDSMIQARPTQTEPRKRTLNAAPAVPAPTAATGNSTPYPRQAPMVTHRTLHTAATGLLKDCCERMANGVETVGQSATNRFQRCATHMASVADMDLEDWRDVADEVCCETDAPHLLVACAAMCVVYCQP
ncbi:hypothetical protein IWQ60_010785 [Tieghemiomyces parasiticus]|uniref:Uncharacterized protein n=1 Tax=Tieghemiomyces parasiticus TaxID=78921 RepID=A0A9W8DMH0_9FUNG|nr:hypothetical protein IWQ60_010785 [Tieghemiomyces parasiticus]